MAALLYSEDRLGLGIQEQTSIGCRENRGWAASNQDHVTSLGVHLLLLYLTLDALADRAGTSISGDLFKPDMW